MISDDDISLTSASSFNLKDFTIPSCWPPRIMDCMKLATDRDRKRALTPSVRNEIVRVLASNMFCHNPNPNKDFCSKVVKMLVKKYKFLCDVGDNVSGFVSINLYSLKDIYFLYFPGFLGEEIDRKSAQHKKHTKTNLRRTRISTCKRKERSSEIDFHSLPT